MTSEYETPRGFTGDRRFLSNFYPSPVKYEGILYPTVEHAYQAAKAEDPELRELIAVQPTPGAAKRQGRRLRLREEWDTVKYAVMADLLRLKFAPDSFLAARLLDTDDEPLVEWNDWHDTVWGRCTCRVHDGRGANRLGKALMLLRDKLRIIEGKVVPA